VHPAFIKEFMAEIETARLRYRMLSPADLESLALILRDPEVMKYLGPEPGALLTRDETKVVLEKMIDFWEEHGFGRWAVVKKVDDNLIGLCGFRLLDSTPELFYLFAREYWGKGLATEAARAALRFGFEELGFERIMAATRHENAASINVLRKIGMHYEREMSHSGIDALCYVAMRAEYQAEDSPYLVVHQQPSFGSRG
jgi:ribosomal-protein-alanine N-acetyltransferase